MKTKNTPTNKLSAHEARLVKICCKEDALVYGLAEIVSKKDGYIKGFEASDLVDIIRKLTRETPLPSDDVTTPKKVVRKLSKKGK